MTTYTYTVLLEPDADNGEFTVTVPELPGCTTEGDTRDEALAMAREAIHGHVEALRTIGEEIPVERIVPELATVKIEIGELVGA